MSNNTTQPQNDKVLEIWVPLKNYEENYDISNYGRLRRVVVIDDIRHIIGKILRPTICKHGYHRYGLTDKNLSRRTYAAHRLVYETFVGSIPDGYEIDHLDDNRANNKPDNLQVLTHKQNMEKTRGKPRRKPISKELTRLRKRVAQLEAENAELKHQLELL